MGKGHEHAQIERQHPAPFSYQDVARLIRFFTKIGKTVLDPFVGVGSTLKAAAIEGRKGIGIELNKKYADLARVRLKTELADEVAACKDQKVIRGDARSVIPTLAANSVKLVVKLTQTSRSGAEALIARILCELFSDIRVNGSRCMPGAGYTRANQGHPKHAIVFRIGVLVDESR